MPEYHVAVYRSNFRDRNTMVPDLEFDYYQSEHAGTANLTAAAVNKFDAQDGDELTVVMYFPNQATVRMAEVKVQRKTVATVLNYNNMPVKF